DRIPPPERQQRPAGHAAVSGRLHRGRQCLDAAPGSVLAHAPGGQRVPRLRDAGRRDLPGGRPDRGRRSVGVLLPRPDLPLTDLQSASLFVLTGAGISADSGVRTFRGAGGLWEGHRPEDVATPAAWARDPALVWRFYQARRAQLPTVQPN